MFRSKPHQTLFTRDYDLGEKLSRRGGGNGKEYDVFQGQKKHFETKVMVRVTDLSKSTGTRARNEIAIMKSIPCQSENIIKFFEAYEDKYKIYSVFEYMERGNIIDHVIKRSENNTYHEKHAALVLTQITEALAFLHANNIVHRDLRPMNILVDSRNVVKIANFGLATKCEPRVKGACGEVYFAAPEVLSNEWYSLSADMWSLGVLAYLILGGYLPFYDVDDEKLLRKILAADFAFHENHWTTVTGRGKNFIRRLLNYNPTSRPTADEVLGCSWFRRFSALPEKSLSLEKGLKRCRTDMLLKRGLTGLKVANYISDLGEVEKSDASLKIDAEDEEEMEKVQNLIIPSHRSKQSERFYSQRS